MSLGPASCRRSEKDQPDASLEGPLPIRPVRVLVASDVERARVRCQGTVLATDENGATLGSYPPDWLVIEPHGVDAVRVAGQSFSTGTIILAGDGTGGMWVSLGGEGEWSTGIEYPGSLRLSVDREGAMDVVNLVDVERYVACVVAWEVWPSFHTEAYRAQAIVARTYVLYQMDRRRNAPFDLGATEGSQVYKGVRRDGPGRRAVRAARDTRGIVCTWRDEGRDRLFSTYYSAACGGVSQSAAIFGEADDIPPLAGGVRCDYCRIAPGETYRWGPVQLSCQDVLSRLVERYAGLASLGDIMAIEVRERTPQGRPVRLRITGSTGQTHDMLSERFRLAVGSMEIKSTDFDVRVVDGQVVFEHGRGFGHGLGLCQWGTQGQALAGRWAGEILRFYYPGSRLTRVY